MLLFRVSIQRETARFLFSIVTSATVGESRIVIFHMVFLLMTGFFNGIATVFHQAKIW